jgi:hypothetical protein
MMTPGDGSAGVEFSRGVPAPALRNDPTTCSCARVHVSDVPFGLSWNPDCVVHGTRSAWWNSPGQRHIRLLDSDRLRVLQALATARRKSPETLPLRVLVCGSRHFADKDRVETAMYVMSDALHGQLAVIAGGARGADALAAAAARRLGVAVTEYRADWATHGEAAGPIRNQQMLAEGAPQVAVGFDARGRGTSDMVARARKAGVVICVLEVTT